MDGFVFTVLLFLAFVILMVFLILNVKGKRAVHLIAVTATLSAWYAGLILDANIDMVPAGFLSFRILLPVLAMGLCILGAIINNKPD